VKYLRRLANWFVNQRVRLLLSEAYRRGHVGLSSAKLIHGTTAPVVMCPSYPANGRHRLLGKVNNQSGHFEFANHSDSSLRQPMLAGEQWMSTTRFFGSCVKESCEHWSGRTCNLGHAVSQIHVRIESSPSNCPIRSSCRWRAENGDTVCSVCPAVRYLDFRNPN
jgi:hypothetical protein